MKYYVFTLTILFSLVTSWAAEISDKESHSLAEPKWHLIGQPQLPYLGDSTGMLPQILFNPSNNQPYIIYNYGGDTEMLRFENDKWLQVGYGAFSNKDSVTLDFSAMFNSKTQELYTVYDYDDKYWDFSYSHGSSFGVDVMKFDHNKWVYIGKFKSVSSGVIMSNITNGSIYVAYEIFNNKSQKSTIIVKEFKDNKWLPLGKIKGFSPQILFNNHDQHLYIIYIGPHNDVVVSVLNNKKWRSVGNIILPSTPYYGEPCPSIAFQPGNNELYFAYIESDIINKAIVTKFDGKSWQSIGKVQLPGKFAPDAIKIYFNPVTQQPYIVYAYTESAGDSQRVDLLAAGVMKFDGTSWLSIGKTIHIDSSSYPPSYLPSIGFDANGELYFTYSDLDSKIRVIKIDQ